MTRAVRSACKLCARQARLAQYTHQQHRYQSTSNAAASSGISVNGSSSSGSAPTSIDALINRFAAPKHQASSLQSQSSAKMPIFDPLRLVGGEISTLRSNVQKLLGSGHPALDTIAKYYFQAEGKHIRPLIVLLISQATNGLSPSYNDRLQRELARGKMDDAAHSIDDPLEVRPDDVLSDFNPSSSSTLSLGTTLPTSNVLPSQQRLAEITEMIHVASLLHDDVIDASAVRRSAPSAPAAFGNKLSILGGDFLLARASLYLSRLGSNEVVELVASVLANLVEGEVMQIKGNAPDSSASSSPSPPPTKLTPEIFTHYMRKTYLKTASLIAKSSRATTVLGGCGIRQGYADGERIKDAAYTYGRNLGIAFQLVDDMLDFTGSDAGLGKPSQGADLKLGLATAPALYAWEEFPEMGNMILRKFENDGDVDQVRL